MYNHFIFILSEMLSEAHGIDILTPSTFRDVSNCDSWYVSFQFCVCYLQIFDVLTEMTTKHEANKTLLRQKSPLGP